MLPSQVTIWTNIDVRLSFLTRTILLVWSGHVESIILLVSSGHAESIVLSTCPLHTSNNMGGGGKEI